MKTSIKQFILALGWAGFLGFSLEQTCQTTVPWAMVCGIILVLFSFFASLTWICIMIEHTEWYMNLERGRMLLQDEEEQGAAPDPKDFELP